MSSTGYFTKKTNEKMLYDGNYTLIKTYIPSSKHAEILLDNTNKKHDYVNYYKTKLQFSATNKLYYCESSNVDKIYNNNDVYCSTNNIKTIKINVEKFIHTQSNVYTNTNFFNLISQSNVNESDVFNTHISKFDEFDFCFYDFCDTFMISQNAINKELNIDKYRALIFYINALNIIYTNNIMLDFVNSIKELEAFEARIAFNLSTLYIFKDIKKGDKLNTSDN